MESEQRWDGPEAAEEDGAADEPTVAENVGRDEPPETMEPPQEDWQTLAESRYDQLVRLHADFENFRRRMERERQDLRYQTLAALAGELLPVYDNLERAVRFMPQDGEAKAWRVGVEMTLKGFTEVLGQWGVEPVEAVGKPFDPQCHEALQRVPSDLPEGVIVNEVLKGFRIGDRILRASQVQVSQGPAEY